MPVMIFVQGCLERRMDSLHRCKDPDILKENRFSPDVTLVEGWVGSCVCQTVKFLVVSAGIS
jgi:hypothetical protein